MTVAKEPSSKVEDSPSEPLRDDQLRAAIRRGVDDYRHSSAEFYAAAKGEDTWRETLAEYVLTRIRWAEAAPSASTPSTGYEQVGGGHGE